MFAVTMAAVASTNKVELASVPQEAPALVSAVDATITNGNVERDMDSSLPASELSLTVLPLSTTRTAMIPEPGTFVFFAGGILAVFSRRRRA